MNIGLMTVASRGKISLSGPRAADAPILLLNYLKEPIDRQSLLAAPRSARKVLSQPAMAQYSGEELDPGRAVQTDEQLDDWDQQALHDRLSSCASAANARSPSGDAIILSKTTYLQSFICQSCLFAHLLKAAS
ncbi:GMC oxidoreductase [Mesorhizobium sp. ArgA1]